MTRTDEDGADLALDLDDGVGDLEDLDGLLGGAGGDDDLVVAVDVFLCVRV